MTATDTTATSIWDWPTRAAELALWQATQVAAPAIQQAQQAAMSDWERLGQWLQANKSWVLMVAAALLALALLRRR